jgi:hypothetical protein
VLGAFRTAPPAFDAHERVLSIVPARKDAVAAGTRVATSRRRWRAPSGECWAAKA